jgi:hypothetical protein
MTFTGFVQEMISAMKGSWEMILHLCRINKAYRLCMLFSIVNGIIIFFAIINHNWLVACGVQMGQLGIYWATFPYFKDDLFSCVNKMIQESQH